MIHTLRCAQGYLIFHHYQESSLSVSLQGCLEATFGFYLKHHEWLDTGRSFDV